MEKLASLGGGRAALDGPYTYMGGLLTTLPLWAPLLAVACVTWASTARSLLLRLLRLHPLSGGLARSITRFVLGTWIVGRLARALGRRSVGRRGGRAGGRAFRERGAGAAGGLPVPGTSTTCTTLRMAVGAVDISDFYSFRAGVAAAPAALPRVEGAWQAILEKSSNSMEYKAWRHNLPSGAAEYISQTVLEGRTPEELLQFFNDDVGRQRWDDMLAETSTLATDSSTGAEVVRWVRRFPLMCAPRDYVFSRRSWADGDGTYYTVSKSCTTDLAPPQPNIRRVTEFFSAWRMRRVTGRNGGVACEVILRHYEDGGIQHDIARLAIRRGMWGCVVNMEQGIADFCRRQAACKRDASRRRYRPLAPAPASRGPAEHIRHTVRRRHALIHSIARTGLMALGGVTLAKKAAGVGGAALHSLAHRLPLAPHKPAARHQAGVSMGVAAASIAVGV